MSLNNNCVNIEDILGFGLLKTLFSKQKIDNIILKFHGESPLNP